MFVDEKAEGEPYRKPRRKISNREIVWIIAPIPVCVFLLTVGILAERSGMYLLSDTCTVGARIAALVVSVNAALLWVRRYSLRIMKDS
jgi:hypothetical protein